VVTMRDVAKMAGVSITTVSHVVNSTRPVAEDTKVKVLAAIEETGYTGDAIARSLVTGGTRSLGVAISLVANPYFAELIRAIEHEITRSGYTLVLADTHDEPAAEQAAVRTLRSRRVDGLILTPSPRATGTVLPELRTVGIPTVLVDRLTTSQEIDQVGPENVYATSGLVQHLASLGHRRIGMISGADGLATSTERVLGYRLGLGRAKLTWDPALVVSGASAEPDLALVLAEGHRRHVEGARGVVGVLQELGALDGSVTVEAAVDTLSVTTDVSIALLLADAYGWSLEAIEAWIIATNRALLLGRP